MRRHAVLRTTQHVWESPATPAATVPELPHHLCKARPLGWVCRPAALHQGNVGLQAGKLRCSGAACSSWGQDRGRPIQVPNLPYSIRMSGSSAWDRCAKLPEAHAANLGGIRARQLLSRRHLRPPARNHAGSQLRRQEGKSQRAELSPPTVSKSQSRVHHHVRLYAKHGKQPHCAPARGCRRPPTRVAATSAAPTCKMQTGRAAGRDQLLGSLMKCQLFAQLRPRCNLGVANHGQQLEQTHNTTPKEKTSAARLGAPPASTSGAWGGRRALICLLCNHARAQLSRLAQAATNHLTCQVSLAREHARACRRRPASCTAHPDRSPASGG